jgi:hypothetical protein
MRSADGVRRAVEAMNQEVELLVELERSAVANGRALVGLRETWGELLELLAPNPAPAGLRCPHCGGVGTFDEIHCRTCWEELAPVQARQ